MYLNFSTTQQLRCRSRFQTFKHLKEPVKHKDRFEQLTVNNAALSNLLKCIE